MALKKSMNYKPGSLSGFVLRYFGSHFLAALVSILGLIFIFGWALYFGVLHSHSLLISPQPLMSSEMGLK